MIDGKLLARALLQPMVADAAYSKLNLAKLVCDRSSCGQPCGLMTMRSLNASFDVVGDVICLILRPCRRFEGPDGRTNLLVRCNL